MPVSPDKDPYYRLRHSAAHVMAEAVLEEFPEGKSRLARRSRMASTTISTCRARSRPRTCRRSRRMRRIINEDHPFVYRKVSADAARALFAGQPYKVELIDGLAHGLDKSMAKRTTATR